MSWALTVALFSCLLLAASAAKFKPDEVPDWVFMGPQRPQSQEDYDQNLADVARMNDAGERYDLIQYGDSLTADMRDSRAEVWDEVFPPSQYRAQPLGMGGSTVEELAYRIVKGGETPDLPPPKLAVLLVGYNNYRYQPKSDPADKLDWLLQWMDYNWPSTKLAVSALLPNRFIDVADANKEIAAVAEQRGAAFFDCGEGLDPNNDEQYSDGTHLLPPGQRVWLECMKGVADGLLSSASASAPAPSS